MGEISFSLFLKKKVKQAQGIDDSAQELYANKW